MIIHYKQTISENQEREALAHLMIALRRFLHEVGHEKTDTSFTCDCSPDCARIVNSINDMNRHVEYALKRLDGHH